MMILLSILKKKGTNSYSFLYIVIDTFFISIEIERVRMLFQHSQLV